MHNFKRRLGGCRLGAIGTILSFGAIWGSILPAADPKRGPNESPEASNRRSTVNPLVAVLQTPAGARLDPHGDPMPAGMIQRLGTTRFKSTGWWRQMAFAGNDEWIWLKSDERVDVMHRETGRVVPFEKLRLGEGSVGCLAASADGSRVAIGFVQFPRDGSRDANFHVAILSARTTAHLHELTWIARGSSFTCLAFSGDGKKLLSATEWGDLQLWDSETGERLAEQHVEPVTFRDAALSPDGKRAVLTGWNRSCRFWKIDENEVVDLPGRREGYSTCYAPDGKSFATISNDGIRLWDPDALTILAHLKQASGYSGADFGIAFTPDSRFLTVPVSTENAVELWDVEQSKCVATMPTDAPRGAVVSNDGRWIAASGESSTISIYDLQRRQAVSRSPGHNSPVDAVRFTQDGALVTGATGDAIVWNVVTGQPEFRLEHEKKVWVRGLAISPKDGSIVTSAFDDTLGIWERSTGKRLLTLKGHSRYGSLRSVEFDADNGQLVSWGDDAVLRRWNPNDGTLISERRIHFEGAPDPKELGERGFVLRGTLAPRATALFVGLQNDLIEIDPASGKTVRREPTQVIPENIAFSADGRWIAGGQVVRRGHEYAGSNALLVDRATLKPVRRWLFGAVNAPLDVAIPAIDPADADDQILAPIRALAFSPDSRRVAWSRSGKSPLIEVADILTGRIIARIPLTSPCGALEFSPDGRQLATGHYDTTVAVWQLDHPDFVPNQIEEHTE